MKSKPPSPFSSQHDSGLTAEARRIRGELREAAIQYVVDAVQSYTAELERDDGAHGGRLARRKGELIQAIHAAHNDFREGPITDEEIEDARSMLRAKEWGDSQRRR